MPDRPGRPKRVVRVCWERLAESPVRRSFNSCLRESFDHVLGEAGDIESEWTMFRASIAVAARWLVPVVAAMPEPGQCLRDAVKLKKESYWALLACGTPEAADGVLLTSTRDVVDRWKEYFKDLLNPTNTPSSEEAPGVDEIHPEFLKALDVVGQSWLTRLRNIAWTSGAVPLDWQTGVVYSGVLERRVRRRVEPRIQEEQCGFCPGRGTVDQLYTLSRVFEGARVFAQPVHMGFVDLEKAFDHDTGLYDRCQSLVRIAGTRDLQLTLDRFAAACEAAGMKISTSKSEAMVLNRKKVECLLRVKEEILPQVEEFKYLGVLFTSEGRMEREIDRRIGAASAVMHRSVVVKKELSQKAKLSIYRSIFVPTLTYGHELWELGVESLLLRVERSQMRWLGHLVRMPPGRLPGEVFRACPSGRRPSGRPRTCWRDYVSRLVWERLGIPLDELEEVAGEREVWASLLRLLPPRPNKR
ncbi:hypothetical protein D4764_05G0011360 [Takifugu flavidus]|uniref:Reverse transcriptase domain-containing protein n=1 Tax=Takifugu flavidus TaxID=433684 RepID=A0A5C6N1G7_9TELE|nr:hypothetical protein D4764_05G0011360 [Takifugu flavidus]